MVALTPGRWATSGNVAQSKKGVDVLSNGSAHLGSSNDRHTQHLIPVPKSLKETRKNLENLQGLSNKARSINSVCDAEKRQNIHLDYIN